MKAKKQARNSSLSNRAREHSCQPQGMRRTPPVSAQARRARASALLPRKSNAQHRNQFKSKRAQGRLGLCCSRCFRFRRALVLALCAPQVGVLPRKLRRSSHRCHRPQAPAPLTRTTRRSQHPQCLTQPRERLFPALSALSSPLALHPALLLQVRRCTRFQLNTQQRAAHRPLRVL